MSGVCHIEVGTAMQRLSGKLASFLLTCRISVMHCVAPHGVVIHAMIDSILSACHTGLSEYAGNRAVSAEEIERTSAVAHQILHW